MAGIAHERVRVSDLRGSAATVPRSAVLEDPSGRRRRRLRLAGRVVAFALTLWLVALILGGVGLSPVPGVPFAHILRPAAPPVHRNLPKPEQPTAADLQPALPVGHPRTATPPRAIPVPGSGSTRTKAVSRAPATRVEAKQHAVAVHTMPPAVDGTTRAAPAITHPNNGRGTGTTTTTTTTTTPGRSGTAPGQTQTTPGRGQSTTRTP
jgi:hypothetical protein